MFENFWGINKKKRFFLLNLAHTHCNINNERSFIAFSKIEHLRGLKEGEEEKM